MLNGASICRSTAAYWTSSRWCHWYLKLTMGITESMVSSTPAPKCSCFFVALSQRVHSHPLNCSSQAHPLTDSSSHPVAKPLQFHLLNSSQIHFIPLPLPCLSSRILWVQVLQLFSLTPSWLWPSNRSEWQTDTAIVLERSFEHDILLLYIL